MQKLLSVIIPTYKRTQLLKRTINSVHSATSIGKNDIEIIVIDDCPNGSAFEVTAKFNAKYIYKAGQERGLSSSRNLGIKFATGQYICFIDDDDYFNENSLDALLSTASNASGLIFGNYKTTHSDDAKPTVHHNLSTLTIEHLLICNQIPVGAYLIRKGDLQCSFDETMRSHEDWDFILRHATRLPIHHVEVEVVNIDKTENEFSSMQARRRSLFWQDFLTIYARFPAPHLAELRSKMLESLGIKIPFQLLSNSDQI
jgi:glycosyltransferase involved in cell wall biosynthesis